MTEPSFFERHVGQSLSEFVELPPDQRAAAVRAALPDLNAVFEPARSPEERAAPEHVRRLARGLLDAIGGAEPVAGLAERVITDELLRHEADRDQNVYLGKLFTRRMTRAVPDLIFQPASADEAAAALRWARANDVPVTLRGAGTTAMGGSVPNDAGLTLDLSRLDTVEIDVADRVCVIGAGARMRTIHARLAERGLALGAYPSNLGATLVGWFVTGGIGLNAFARGRALDAVRSADVVLPSGDHLRFHDDGRLDVLEPEGKRKTYAAGNSEAWFREHQLEPLALSDIAGSEGVLGLVLQLTVAVEPLPEIGAFLLSFDSEADAFAAAGWIAQTAGRDFGTPANLKFLTSSHLHHVRRVWEDEVGRGWRRFPGALSDGAGLPWSQVTGARELGARTSDDDSAARGYLFVDFLDLGDARAFAKALQKCPGCPRVLGEESLRFARERFKPQMTKRLGPGLLAAEILMQAEHVARFLPRARKLAHNFSVELDAEVYFLEDGEALVIAAYLTDHRNGTFHVDLLLAPALVDLAMARYGGRPYVLGRWQSPWFTRKFGRPEAARVRRAKHALDGKALLNRGVLTGLALRGVRGGLIAGSFVPAMGFVRRMFAWPVTSVFARMVRRMFGVVGGPARGRGAPAVIGARFEASAALDRGRPVAAPSMNGEAATMLAVAPSASTGDRHRTAPSQPVEDRALHCVNCGECNTVCPIFDEAKIRLPQMLTHLGEATRGGEPLGESASALLDLCMRCGNCEEVCQAGIPHLPLYESLQRVSDAARPRDVERHAAIVASVRGSQRYLREFLGVRPGGYQKRSPASLPGLTRYVVLRAENDAGPAATCIHCAACVDVCPTQANREFEGADPRAVTTVQSRCIGCGTCVEVCPANLANGGQTLRVMEAPTRDWFVALEELERQELP